MTLYSAAPLRSIRAKVSAKAYCTPNAKPAPSAPASSLCKAAVAGPLRLTFNLRTETGSSTIWEASAVAASFSSAGPVGNCYPKATPTLSMNCPACRSMLPPTSDSLKRPSSCFSAKIISVVPPEACNKRKRSTSGPPALHTPASR